MIYGLAVQERADRSRDSVNHVRDSRTSSPQGRTTPSIAVPTGRVASRGTMMTAALLFAMVSAILATLDPRLRHWFLAPVTICAVLLGPDVLDWLRRRCDVLDPQALVSLIGIHFFYAAPILHVLLDFWMWESFPSDGWRNSLGAMATLNAVGLAAYRAILSMRARSVRRRPARQLNERVFQRVGITAVTMGVTAFIVEVMMFGGVQGFITTMTSNRTELAGWGWMLIVAESFPLLTFAVAVVRWRQVLARRPIALLFLWLTFAVVQFAVSGVRGSRNNTVWPVLVGVILIHYLVLRLSRRTLLGFIAGFAVFMYAYGLYKGAGIQVLEILNGQRTVAEVSHRTGRGVPTVLLGDLGRADVQATVLEGVRSGQVKPAMGVTYIAAPMLLVPQGLIPERPRGKVAVGTDALYGNGAYDAGVRSSRVYGITGEAILNFGAPGGLFSFVVLGMLVRTARRYCGQALNGGRTAPKMLSASLTVATLSVLSWDADNLVWFSLKHVLPLVLVVVVARAWPTPQPGERRRSCTCC
ncbi:hypothetical protein AB0J80_24125 [Actinoplanes sp. NPDC049548]|uniref:hypothetical protein n=1 Tax=Actinoplanes sp. NPDC049548 TaxID=3155152 RepID=UPI00343F288C